MLAIVLIAGCGGGDVEPGSASPTPTPTATPTLTPTPSPTATPASAFRVGLVSTSGAFVHEGQVAMLRLIPASGPSLCASVRADDGMPWGFVIASAGLASAGTTYAVEVVLGGDGTLTYEEGVDHALTHAPITVTSDLTLTLTHADLAAGGWTDGGGESVPPPSFSWADGATCPGDSR